MLHVTSVKKSENLGVKDLVAILILIALISLIEFDIKQMHFPIQSLARDHISLSWVHLPEYALRTTLRMFFAILCSLVFSIIYGTLAAKYQRLEPILISILDILQSVPILGYLSFTITFFVNLYPNSILGIELASIFAIFSSQAWNIAFSFYQGLKTVPADLIEAASIMKLSKLEKFFRLELPCTIPGLLWNTMMSMSGGWFFIVAAEAIIVNMTEYCLPGIGSYISLAIANKNISAILAAIVAMILTILLYDQLLFRTVVAWSNKFKYETNTSNIHPRSWVLNLFRNTKLILVISNFCSFIFTFIITLSYKIQLNSARHSLIGAANKKLLFNTLWYSLLFVICLYGGVKSYSYIQEYISVAEVLVALNLGLITATRVVILILLSIAFWTPIGIYIGLNSKLTAILQPVIQFLAAFPVNLLFPLIVSSISYYKANPNIWLSPLIIMGSQWYILFNVIAGAATFPNDLKEACTNFSIKGFLWWYKVIIPAIAPYLITGAITAAGGAWNASIVGEIVNWGDTTLIAKGIGSYIACATTAGDFTKVVIGITILSTMVIACNKIIWRPLYKIVETKN